MVKNKLHNNPLDYRELLKELIRGSLNKASIKKNKNIIDIGIGTTSSTLAPVDSEGTVLS